MAYEQQRRDHPSVVSLMAEDARAALERDPAAEGMTDIILFSTGTRIVWAHRRHHWLHTHGFRRLACWLANACACGSVRISTLR